MGGAVPWTLLRAGGHAALFLPPLGLDGLDVRASRLLSQGEEARLEFLDADGDVVASRPLAPAWEGMSVRRVLAPLSGRGPILVVEEGGEEVLEAAVCSIPEDEAA